MDEFLSLTDYASKYKISITTLRRKIKSNLIPYKMEKGKYLLRDQQPSVSHGLHRPSHSVMNPKTMRGALEIIAQKDFEITRLKGKIVDLETLVQVLEGEIDRIKARSPYFHPSAQS
jgi:replication initiation and membrane attachment protein DnaB